MTAFAKLAVAVCFYSTMPSAGLLVEETDYYDEVDDYYQEWYAPASPAVPGLPDLPSVPKIPGLPDIPSVPKIPGIPDIPGVSMIPGLPDLLPGMPEIPGLPDFAGDLGKALEDAAGSTKRKIALAATLVALVPKIAAALTRVADEGPSAVVEVICVPAIQIAVGDTFKQKFPADAKALCMSLAPNAAQAVTDLMTSSPEPASLLTLKAASVIVNPAVEKGFAELCEPQLERVIKLTGDPVTAIPAVVEFINTGFCKVLADKAR